MRRMRQAAKWPRRCWSSSRSSLQQRSEAGTVRTYERTNVRTGAGLASCG
jgi:hypothetical protein